MTWAGWIAWEVDNFQPFLWDLNGDGDFTIAKCTKDLGSLSSRACWVGSHGRPLAESG